MWRVFIRPIHVSYQNAQRIDTMSFAEAAEMATFGAKVLHPATLLPAVRSNIPVYVGSLKHQKLAVLG